MIKQCLSVLILSAGLVSLSAYSDTTKNIPNPPINVTMDMKNIPAIDLQIHTNEWGKLENAVSFSSITGTVDQWIYKGGPTSSVTITSIPITPAATSSPITPDSGRAGDYQISCSSIFPLTASTGIITIAVKGTGTGTIGKDDYKGTLTVSLSQSTYPDATQTFTCTIRPN